MTAMIGPQDMGEWMHMIERRIEEVATAALRRPALNRVENGDFTVANGGSVRVVGGGDMVVDPEGEAKSSDFEAGASGWRLTGDSAEFNDLALRGGIIGNDALANPVRGDVMRQFATNFALTTGFSTVASQTWQVPAGFGQVAVSVLAKVFAYNSTAGLDYISARARIVRVSDGAEVLGVATPTAVSASGGSGTSIGPGVAVIGFNPGDSLRIEVQARTSFAGWAANAGNVAEVAGSLTWYR